MDNKYYTPDIEDLFIGYECEIYAIKDKTPIQIHEIEKKLKGERIWESHIIEHVNRDLGILKEGNLRTPYLTKEQIEGEGWKYNKEYISFVMNNGWSLMKDYTLNKYSIYYYGDGYFHGEIKSINEFRKIIKWLKINE